MQKVRIHRLTGIRHAWHRCQRKCRSGIRWRRNEAENSTSRLRSAFTGTIRNIALISHVDSGIQGNSAGMLLLLMFFAYVQVKNAPSCLPVCTIWKFNFQDPRNLVSLNSTQNISYPLGNSYCASAHEFDFCLLLPSFLPFLRADCRNVAIYCNFQLQKVAKIARTVSMKPQCYRGA